jgi:hypothetical protein
MKTRRRKRNARIDPKLIEKIVERMRKLKMDPELIEWIRNLNLDQKVSGRIPPPPPPEPQTYVRYIDGTPVGFWGYPPGAKLSEEQLQAERRRLKQRITRRLPRGPIRCGKTILYSGKLDQIWGTPLGSAKWIAEEIRTNPSVGWRLFEQEVQLRRNEKGYVSKMVKALVKYLEDQQPMFDQVDYQLVDIVEQNPQYTIKEITYALSKKYPEQKWTEQKLKTLARRVQRLLENVPWYVPR